MDKRAGFGALGFLGSEYDISTNPVGSHEYVEIEEYIRGNYVKFNSNYGYVNHAMNSTTMPAFSHWTFHESNGQVLVFDLQGVLISEMYRLTDPAIHSSVAKTYGLTDHGVLGQAQFFRTHTCNNICRGWKKLKLTSELDNEVSRFPATMHTTFSFQLPRGIKTDRNDFRNITIIEE